MSKSKLILTNVGALLVLRISESEKAILKQLGNIFHIEGKEKILQGTAKRQANFERRMLDSLKELDLDNPQELNASSPEIKSLKMIGISESDKVILYATDTFEGVLAGRLVEKFVSTKFGCQVELKVIDGLQVDDAGRFRSVGVPKYAQSIIRTVDQNQYSFQIMLNATAGFKSVIPYLTIIGMLYRVPMVYVFERSAELLTLPPIPVEFDRGLFARVESLLSRIEKEGVIPANEFWRSVSDIRDEILPFIEQDGEVITLSAMGIIFYEKYKSVPPIPNSSRRPEDKDHTKAYGKEPHRKAEFEKFKDKLANYPWVEGFRYLRGANETIKDVKRMENRLHITYEGIVLEVETTAIHDEHWPEIETALKNLME